MGCPPIIRMVQRTGQSHETEEVRTRVHPTVQNLQVPFEEEVDGESLESNKKEALEEDSILDVECTQKIVTACNNRRERIKWPASSEKEGLGVAFGRVGPVLEKKLAGTVGRKIAGMTTITYSMGKSRFGIQEKKEQRTKPVFNRRRRKIAQLRRKVRSITTRFTAAQKEETTALADLISHLQEQIASLRRAKNSRKNRKERVRKRTSFKKNFQFTKKLLEDKRSGRLECPKQEVEDHLRKIPSDVIGDQNLGDPNSLLTPDLPTAAFVDTEPRLQGVKDTIRKARTGSTPGPNRISYKVYNICQMLLRRLWYGVKNSHQPAGYSQRNASYQRLRINRLEHSSLK